MSVDPVRSAASRKVRQSGASPWNRGPMVDTPAAKKAHLRYQKVGKAMKRAARHQDKE